MSGILPSRDPEALFNYLIAQKIIANVTRAYPWYDAVWLRRYVAAKAMIERVRPETLPEFIQAFARLRTPADFVARKLDRVFDDAMMERIRETIRTLPANAYENHEIGRFGRVVVHDHPFFTDLQKTIQPRICELTGEIVEPSYNFLSLYSQLGVCQPHMDAPNAKWTLDLCIDQSDVWPIHLSQIVPWPENFCYKGDDWQAHLKQLPDLHFTPYRLRPNEAVLFSGSSQWHYRDSLSGLASGGFCNLLFFHFLPRGMREIVRPENWPAMFDIPELAGVVGHARSR